VFIQVTWCDHEPGNAGSWTVLGDFPEIFQSSACPLKTERNGLKKGRKVKDQSAGLIGSGR